MPDPHFESGVVKIQLGRLNQLMDAEKVAVESLKKGNTAGGAAVAPAGNQPASPQDMQTRIAQALGQGGQQENVYINCDFILGSAAEVERLWSVCYHVLTDNWKGMTPQLFEALVFLCKNKLFWDQELVSLNDQCQY